MSFLYDIKVLLKDFNSYVERTTKQLKEASMEEARRIDRPVRYLASNRIRAEYLARPPLSLKKIRYERLKSQVFFLHDIFRVFQAECEDV